MIMQPLGENKENFLLNFSDIISFRFGSVILCLQRSAPKRSDWPETISHLQIETVSCNKVKTFNEEEFVWAFCVNQM